MTDEPKRRWFQIHLSTAIMAMFLASGLIGANLVMRNYPTTLGWPIPCTKSWTELHGTTIGYFEWYPEMLVLDIGIALAILASSTILFEFSVRRYEAANPTPFPKRRWFQFHLSTAFILMLVAGGLLWANLYVMVIHPTVFDAGLPLMDDGSEGSGIRLHTPLTLPVNVGLNLGFIVGVAAICERFVRPKSVQTSERITLRARLRNLHRHTKIALAIAFAIIMLLNAFCPDFEYESLSGHYGSVFYGWPYATGFYGEFYCATGGLSVLPNAKGYVLSGFSWTPYAYSLLVVDLVLWLCMAVLIVLIGEWLCRRKPSYDV